MPFKNLNLPLITEQTAEVAQKAAQFIAQQAGKVENKEIITKYHNNLVSYVDIEAEKIIVQNLKKIVPQAAFIAEEQTTDVDSNAPFQWIIDPLDGTTNFLQQVPQYAVSIALAYNLQPIVAVVYDVCHHNCYYAHYQSGAFMNGKRISTSQTFNLQESCIATGFPYYDFSIIEEYMQLLKQLVLRTKSIRRMGAASLDLCYVAAAKFDAYFEFGLSPWDVAAGALIVKEAGGQVADFNGNGDFIFGKQIIATNTPMYPQFLQIVKQYLGSKI